MSAPIFDMHVDFIIQQRLFGYDALKRHRAGMKGQPLFWHADIPRMKEANYAGACLGVHWYPWQSERGFGEMHKQIDYLDNVIGKADGVVRVRQPSDWIDAYQNGKLAVAPGVEGAHMLNGKLERVQALADRDAAYLTITHFSKNDAATPSMGRGANEEDGLTAFGRDLVQALEDVDVLIDLAHVNTPGVLEVLGIATKPLLCTHTGVRGVHDHARNISDEEIDGIKELNGVIGIIFAPMFLAGTTKATSEAVLDHIEYTVDRAGIDHVGIGSDFDGWVPIPKDMRDCTDMSVISDGLTRRGFDDESKAKVLGRNVMEVLSRQRHP